MLYLVEETLCKLQVLESLFIHGIDFSEFALDGRFLSDTHTYTCIKSFFNTVLKI